jgi:hypothetical protein
MLPNCEIRAAARARRAAVAARKRREPGNDLLLRDYCESPLQNDNKVMRYE